jgi:hypothetical protein
MPPTNLIGHFPRRPSASACYILKPLPDCLVDISAGGNVEQGSLRLAFANHAAPTLLELFHESPGQAPLSPGSPGPPTQARPNESNGHL